MDDLYWSFIQQNLQQKQVTTSILEKISFINNILFILVITAFITPLSFVFGYVVGSYFKI